jgi:hypothetical protein
MRRLQDKSCTPPELPLVKQEMPINLCCGDAACSLSQTCRGPRRESEALIHACLPLARLKLRPVVSTIISRLAENCASADHFLLQGDCSTAIIIALGFVWGDAKDVQE